MAKELHIRIDSHIGVIEDSYGFLYIGFTADELDWRMIEMPDPKKLVLHIGSEGGDIWEGLRIYSRLMELREAGTKIEVIIESICYSMATVIAMSASPGMLLMRDTALWSVHKPLVGVYGNADDLRKKAEELDNHESALTNAYTARTGKDLSQIQSALREDKIINADEALAQGWIDDLITTPSMVANAKATAFKPVAFVRNTKTLEENDMALNEQDKKSFLNEIATFFGLSPKNEVTEPVAEPIAAVEPVAVEEPQTDPKDERIKQLEQELEQLKPKATEAETKQAELDAATQKLTELQTQFDNLKNFVPGSGDNSEKPAQQFANYNKQKENTSPFTQMEQNVKKVLKK